MGRYKELDAANSVTAVELGPFIFIPSVADLGSGLISVEKLTIFSKLDFREKTAKLVSTLQQIMNGNRIESFEGVHGMSHEAKFNVDSFIVLFVGFLGFSLFYVASRL